MESPLQKRLGLLVPCCVALTANQAVRVPRRTEVCEHKSSSTCLKKGSSASLWSGSLQQIPTTSTYMWVCPLILTPKLSTGSSHVSGQSTTHSSCSLMGYFPSWPPWLVLPNWPDPICGSTPVLVGIPPHLCDPPPVMSITALPLHTDL